MTGPILLFGLPRSGTSWLGKIFDSHPETVYRHEPDNFPRLDAIPMFAAANEVDCYRPVIQGFMADLPRLNTSRCVAKLPVFRKSYRTGLNHQLLRIGVVASKLGDRVLPGFPVIGSRTDRVRPEPVMVWKSIESLGRFGLILKMLNNACGIHLIRHPCGQINSVLRGEAQAAFQDKNPSSEYYSLYALLVKTPQAMRRGLTLDELKRLTPEERMAWRWVLVNEKARDDVAGMERARTVRYEDLCENPSTMTRELFSFTGLNWNKPTEMFLQQSVYNEKTAYYSVFKNPRHSAERWREELSPSAIDRILAIIRESPLADLYESGRMSAA